MSSCFCVDLALLYVAPCCVQAADQWCGTTLSVSSLALFYSQEPFQTPLSPHLRHIGLHLPPLLAAAQGWSPPFIIALRYFRRAEMWGLHLRPVWCRCPEVESRLVRTCAVRARGCAIRGASIILWVSERKSFLQQLGAAADCLGLFVYLSAQNSGRWGCLEIAWVCSRFAYLSLLGAITLRHLLEG